MAEGRGAETEGEHRTLLHRPFGKSHLSSNRLGVARRRESGGRQAGDPRATRKTAAEKHRQRHRPNAEHGAVRSRRGRKATGESGISAWPSPEGPKCAEKGTDRSVLSGGTR